VDDKTRLDLYRVMVLSRTYEEAILREYHADKKPAFDIGVAAARAATEAEAARRYGPLRRRVPSAAESRWQERLLAERYRIDSWHLTGRTKEAQWTTRPVLTCTG